jgi:hypothetical protein
MIQISHTNLVDHEMIRASQARLDDATAKFENAKTAVTEADRAVSAAWDASVAQIATGGDALAGAEAHAAAVARRDFELRLADEYQKNVAVEQENHRLAKIKAHEPVLRKGRELRLAAAKAFDLAERAKADADALAQQGSGLLAVAHSAGLRHFHLNEAGRGARSEATESQFLEAEATGAKAFWGREI